MIKWLVKNFWRNQECRIQKRKSNQTDQPIQPNQSDKSNPIDEEQRQDTNVSDLENRSIELLKVWTDVTTKEITKNWRLRIIR